MLDPNELRIRKALADFQRAWGMDWHHKINGMLMCEYWLLNAFGQLLDGQDRIGDIPYERYVQHLACYVEKKRRLCSRR
jgi:hypothetical protein